MTTRYKMTVSLATGVAAAVLPLAALAVTPESESVGPDHTMTYFHAIPGARSRDVAFAEDGSVWYAGQRDGTLTRLDPDDGSLTAFPLGENAAPHGVVLGPDNAFWITEGGQNAIARLNPEDGDVTLFPLPEKFANANLNTGVFDHDGIYWFTGQNGVLGRLDPTNADLVAWDAPGGAGPYGITVTPSNEVWYASLAGNHIARINKSDLSVKQVKPPTENQGARRIWSDSSGMLWVSEWNSGNVSRYDPVGQEWSVWALPGDEPRTYSVYVDETDNVWLTDFGANSIVLFDPETESFTVFESNLSNANVRHMAGREGEVWGGESGTDRLIRITFPTSDQLS